MKDKIAEVSAQQGDVILRKLIAMPDGIPTLITRKHLVLAHGESGHSHVIEDDEAELIQIGDRMLLKLAHTTTVTHEEHKPVRLSPGIWEVGRVVEYDYFSQMKSGEVGRVQEYDHLSQMKGGEVGRVQESEYLSQMIRLVED